MADYKITQLTTVTAPPAGALVPIVDVTDTVTVPAGPGGSNKAILAGSLSLSKVAATPVAGYSLVNGTGAIITWTAPNDGQLHRVAFFASMHVTVAETGGQINFGYTLPDSTAAGFTAVAGGQAPGPQAVFFYTVVIGAGTAAFIQQVSALTAGAAKIWAEIWGS